MSAPESVVRAVMEALGCCKVSVDPDPTLARPWCEQHEGWWDDRGCPEALLAADAAWVASLNAAAERLEGSLTGRSILPAQVACGLLRRWAGEQERGERC